MACDKNANRRRSEYNQVFSKKFSIYIRVSNNLYSIAFTGKINFRLSKESLHLLKFY
jgi:hypothetical protein